MARTKIVTTLGPASSNDETIMALMRAGADVFRLNMSHGELTAHIKLIKRLRTLPGRHGLGPPAILADLSGPKVRVGSLTGGTAELVRGARVTLLSREAPRKPPSSGPIGPGGSPFTAPRNARPTNCIH